MAITKTDITNKYNTFFGTNKSYYQLSKEEISLIAQILTAENVGTGGGNNGGGGIATSIKIIDSDNDELKITSTGKLDINSIASLPSLATGSNVIGSISNSTFNSTQSGIWSFRNQDGTGNNLTSQINGTQRALDVGLNVSGVQVDPRQIRTLTSTDVVSSAQSGTWNIANITGTISLPTGASTETTLANLSAKLPSTLVNNRLSVDGSGVTQPISVSSLPLPSGASTSALQTTTNTNLSSIIALLPGFGNTTTPSSNVLSIQGVTNGKVVRTYSPLSSSSSSVTFTTSTFSTTFTYSDKCLFAVIPAITGAPTITVQISVDGGTTWVDSSVSVTSSATLPTLIESDSFARLAGLSGLTNALRFKSSTSISATVTVISGTF